MRIEAHPIKAGELRPGDLFSGAGPMHWDFRDRLAVGEKVFIRTEGPCPAEQVDDIVFRIVIHHEAQLKTQPAFLCDFCGESVAAGPDMNVYHSACDAARALEIEADARR